jgi:DNA-binding NarL/FixJ family response regulator
MTGTSASERMARIVQTVLIVDDHAGFRSLARRLLEAAGFEVVGEAEDGASAIELAWGLRPAIVLLDVQLPDFDGFEVAKRLSDEGLGAATVLISTRDRTAYRRRLATSPVRGFIAKGELSGAALKELVG